MTIYLLCCHSYTYYLNHQSKIRSLILNVSFEEMNLLYYLDMSGEHHLHDYFDNLVDNADDYCKTKESFNY